jgi:pilus assembly protein Flp/PilA
VAEYSKSAVDSISKLSSVRPKPSPVSGGKDMKNFAMKLKRFLKSEDGPTAVEYAVMLSLIIVICLGAVRTIGTNANSTFSAVATQISGS